MKANTLNVALTQQRKFTPRSQYSQKTNSLLESGKVAFKYEYHETKCDHKKVSDDPGSCVPHHWSTVAVNSESLLSTGLKSLHSVPQDSTRNMKLDDASAAFRNLPKKPPIARCGGLTPVILPPGRQRQEDPCKLGAKHNKKNIQCSLRCFPSKHQAKHQLM